MYCIVQFLDPDLHGMDKFDPPIPVLIQHLDNLLEPHVVRNLLNSLHSKQHLVNANHRLPATEIKSCSVMTHVKPLVETAFIRSIFKIDRYIYIHVCMHVLSNSCPCKISSHYLSKYHISFISKPDKSICKFVSN